MDYTKDITIHIKGKHFSIGDRRELQGMLSGASKRPSLRKQLSTLITLLIPSETNYSVDLISVKALYNYVDTALLKVRNIDLRLKIRLKAALS